MLSEKSLCEVARVLENERFLTAGGFGRHDEDGNIFFKAEPVESRLREFAGHPNMKDEWESCCDFVSQCKRLKKISDEMWSYGWKHRCEQWCGAYISNGMFIAAVIHLGIPYRQCDPKSPNADFALSSVDHKMPPPASFSSTTYRERFPAQPTCQTA